MKHPSSMKPRTVEQQWKRQLGAAKAAASRKAREAKEQTPKEKEKKRDSS